MALVLLEPFDNLTAWSLNGDPTIVAGGRTGTGMQAGGTTTRAVYLIAGPSQSAVVTFGFAWRTPSLVGPRSMCALASTGNTVEQVRLRCNPDGSVDVYNPGGSVQAASVTGVITAANTWHYIEAQITIGDTTGAAVVRVNETTVINATGLDTRSSGAATVYDAVRLGPQVSGSGPIWDDFYLRTGAGESFMGDITLPLPATTVDGTATATLAFDAAATGTVSSVVTGAAAVAVALAVTATGTVVPAAGIVAGTAAVSLAFTAHAVGTRVPVVVTSGLAEALVEFEDQFGEWVDITCDVRSIDIASGRQQVLEQFRAGTLTLTMANFEGINSAWPPDSIWAQAGPRRTNVPIRVSMVRGGVTHRLFTGTTDAVNDSWPRTVDAMVSVLASDGFKDLARYDDLGAPPARWSDDFEVQESGSIVEAVGNWSDEFDRVALGSDWADVSVHGTAQPFTIVAENVVTAEDTTGGTYWAAVRRTIAGSNHIEVTLDDVFPGTPSDHSTVQAEVYVDLGTDGSCECFRAVFDWTGTDKRVTLSVFRYYADGTTGTPIMGDTITPWTATPSSYSLRLDNDEGVYRANFLSFELGAEVDPVGASGSSVGFGLSWDGPSTGTPDPPKIKNAFGGPITDIVADPWPW